MGDTLEFQKKLHMGSYGEISRGKYANTNSSGRGIFWSAVFEFGFLYYWPSSHLSKEKEGVGFAFLVSEFLRQGHGN
jgi:hypothetical protein